MIIYEQINYQDQRFADRYCAPHTGSLQSMGNPYGKPRANPYRLKLQAHPYGNWAFPRTDSRVQQDTLDETLPKYYILLCLYSVRNHTLDAGSYPCRQPGVHQEGLQ